MEIADALVIIQKIIEMNNFDIQAKSQLIVPKLKACKILLESEESNYDMNLNFETLNLITVTMNSLWVVKKEEGITKIFKLILRELYKPMLTKYKLLISHEECLHSLKLWNLKQIFVHQLQRILIIIPEISEGLITELFDSVYSDLLNEQAIYIKLNNYKFNSDVMHSIFNDLDQYIEAESSRRTVGLLNPHFNLPSFSPDIKEYLVTKIEVLIYIVLI